MKASLHPDKMVILISVWKGLAKASGCLFIEQVMIQKNFWDWTEVALIRISWDDLSVGLVS